MVDANFYLKDLCQLQMFNMKPFACKVWPFKVMLKPDKVDREFEGLYQTSNKEYFVYLHPRCLGINRGNPADFKKTIEEIISLWNGLDREQYYSTNRAYLINQALPYKSNIRSFVREMETESTSSLTPSLPKITWEERKGSYQITPALHFKRISPLT